MVPPWFFLLVCRTLLLERHVLNITIIEVYHSLFNVKLLSRRHAVVLNRNFLIALDTVTHGADFCYVWGSRLIKKYQASPESQEKRA